MSRSQLYPAVAFIFLCLCGQVSNTRGAGGVVLTYKFEKGKTYRYWTRSDVETAQTMIGAEMTATTGIISVVYLTVEDIDTDGNITYVSASDSLIIETHSARMETTLVNPYDIVGKRTREIITRYGKRISSSPVDTVDAPRMMGRIRSGTNAVFLEFGEDPVKLGDTWKQTRTDTILQMGGRILTTTDLTFTAVEKARKLGRDCIRISFEGGLMIEGSGIMRGTNTVTEGTGTIRGTSYFAPTEGFLVQSESTMDQEMTVAVTGDQSMTIPISQSVKTTTTLVQ